jgi:SpoVK/Ycf46/Vps4 family AAA+-type ATPase
MRLMQLHTNRDEVSGEVERRVVSQLLTLMDGLEARGKIIIWHLLIA